MLGGLLGSLNLGEESILEQLTLSGSNSKNTQ